MISFGIEAWQLDQGAPPPGGDELLKTLHELVRSGDRQSRIRCPQCAWRPVKTSLWCCLPECGTSWNTFDTRGKCPGCRVQWLMTQCLSCSVFSPHDDWYETPPPSEV